MAGPVFISHSSRDVKIARGICEAIESRGVACWISGRDVGPGENYGDAIVDAIERAQAMVLVFSSNANNSQEIKKELALASQHRVAVIPVRVEDITPSQAFRYELATRQWIDMFVDWDQALKKLTDKIVAIQGIGRPEGDAPPPKPTPSHQSAQLKAPRRVGVLAGAAAAIVAILAAGVFFWTRPGTSGDQPHGPILASQAGANPSSPVATPPVAQAPPAAAVAPAAPTAAQAPAPVAPAASAPASAEPAPKAASAAAVPSAPPPVAAVASAAPTAAPALAPASPAAPAPASVEPAPKAAESLAAAPSSAPAERPAPKPILMASLATGVADAGIGHGASAPALLMTSSPASSPAAPQAPIAPKVATEPARSGVDSNAPPNPIVHAALAAPASSDPPASAATTTLLAPADAAAAPPAAKSAASPAAATAATVEPSASPSSAAPPAPAKAVVVAALASTVETVKPPAANAAGVKTFKDCDDCPEMVVAPTGTALVGSPPQETARMPHEPAPSEAIIAAPFAVGRYDVTFDEWDACVAAGGCNNWRPGDFGWGRGRQPVIFVSWNDAKAYVAWLRQKTGKPYRLLSETEWEYAARGCTTTGCPNQPFWFGGIKPEIANYDARYAYEGSPKGLSRRRAVAADEGPPNPFGLFNMLGNVRQWVEDCWSANPGPAPSGGAPRLSGDCTERVTRGGSYDDKPQELRAAARSWQTAETRSQKIGFRVARALDP
jgi:formylglycine-generating enzyme required for sulfatase activity